MAFTPEPDEVAMTFDEIISSLNLLTPIGKHSYEEQDNPYTSHAPGLHGAGSESLPPSPVLHQRPPTACNRCYRAGERHNHSYCHRLRRQLHSRGVNPEKAVRSALGWLVPKGGSERTHLGHRYLPLRQTRHLWTRLWSSTTARKRSSLTGSMASVDAKAIERRMPVANVGRLLWDVCPVCGVTTADGSPTPGIYRACAWRRLASKQRAAVASAVLKARSTILPRYRCRGFIRCLRMPRRRLSLWCARRQRCCARHRQEANIGQGTGVGQRLCEDLRTLQQNRRCS